MTILFDDDDADEILSDLGLQDEPTHPKKMTSTNLDDLLKNHEKIILKENKVRDFVEKEIGCNVHRCYYPRVSPSEDSACQIIDIIRNRAKAIIPFSKLYKDLTSYQNLNSFLLNTSFSLGKDGEVSRDSHSDFENVVWRFMVVPVFRMRIVFSHITKDGLFSKNQNQNYMNEFERFVYCEADFVECLKDLRDAYKTEADRLRPDLMLEEYL